MLCSDPFFGLRIARDTLLSNLKRLNEAEILLQAEKTLTKSRTKFLRRKVLTPFEEGEKPLHM
jgi:hypothetical protein